MTSIFCYRSAANLQSSQNPLKVLGTCNCQNLTFHSQVIVSENIFKLDYFTFCYNMKLILEFRVRNSTTHLTLVVRSVVYTYTYVCKYLCIHTSWSWHHDILFVAPSHYWLVIDDDQKRRGLLCGDYNYKGYRVSI